MLTMLSNAFPLLAYSDIVQRRRAIGTYATAVLATVLSVLLLALVPFNYTILTGSQRLLYLTFIVVLFIVGLICVYLTRQGRQIVAANLITLTVYVAPLSLALAQAIDARAFLVVAMVVISLSGFLIGGRAPIYTAAITVPMFTLTFTATPFFPNAAWVTIIGLYAPAALIHGWLNYLIGQSLPNLTQAALSRDAARRVLLSDASTAVSQRLLAARLDMDILVKEIVRVVRDTFPDLSHVQIYMIDHERTKATLTATTAEEVSPLHATFSVGSLSLVGRVSVSRESVLSRDTDPASTGERSYLRSGYMPDTRVQVAIPMQLGADIIGVLDFHSSNPTAFLPEDIRVFETLGNQVAVAIDNARLFEEAQTQIAENKRLYEQTRTNLREIERLNQQLTGTAWTDYLGSSTSVPAFSIDVNSQHVEAFADWTPTMAEASRRQQAFVSDFGSVRVLAVPITVRGQVIGALEFELDITQQLSPEQLILVQQAVERLGLTADNARMFEETQRAAHRDAMVGEISTRIQAMTSVDAVVATATQSLGEVIHAKRIAIRLGNPDEE
jgi:GAF domain-containing protein